IFTAKVDKLDPERPGAVLTVDQDLKGKAAFRRLAVNLEGDSGAQREGESAKLLKRLKVGLPLVVFVSRRGKVYHALAYTNGTWCQLKGEADGDRVRWAFLHFEPYLRRTYSGSTADLRRVVLDGLSGKAAPPDLDPKVEPGIGPEVGSVAPPTPTLPRGGGRELRATGGPVFAVIPTVLVGGPLAILALMFPAVFGGLILVFRRWLVVLSVVSIDSTLYVLHDWLAPWLGGSWWGSAQALWVIMTLLTVAGILWAWRRHAATVAEAAPAGPAPTTGRLEWVALWVACVLGLAFVGFCLARRVPLLDESWRKPLLLLCIGLWAGLVYLLGLRLLRRGTPRGGSVPAEGVMLTAMALAAVGLGLPTVTRPAGAGEAVATVQGEAVAEGARPAGLLWKFQAKDAGSIASTPLVAGDRVYVAAAHGSAFPFGRLYCLDRATGKEVWSFDNDGDMKQVFSTPCLADGRLYVGEGFHQDKECRLYCLDAATGKKLWEFATTSHTESSPCVAGGKVYFGAGDDGLFCADAATGKEVWHYPGLHVDCSPCVVGNRLYAGSGVGDTYRDTFLFCLDAEKGTEVWKVPSDLPVWGSPAVSGGQVFYGLGNGNFVESDPKPAGAVLCAEAETGRLIWRCDVPDGVLSRPAVRRHDVCFGCRDHWCYCLDRRDGHLRWKHDMGSPVVAAAVNKADPASAASAAAQWPGYLTLTNSVYAVSSEGRVCCLDAESGSADWAVEVGTAERAKAQCFSSPAVVVTRAPDGERRQVYFGAGLTTPLGTTAALFCYEDRYEE
ncbi:MAG TPA: PQQ-binding-like beta-propeller repeat protein, partial [Gemmataceae bacterium]|nr:PQQ-binding-like beta-propeller repeat protein [Gemmataceae bacterium]